jgi:hypothetical protein
MKWNAKIRMEWLWLMRVLSKHFPGEIEKNHEPLRGQLMTGVGFEQVASPKKVYIVSVL